MLFATTFAWSALGTLVGADENVFVVYQFHEVGGKKVGREISPRQIYTLRRLSLQIIFRMKILITGASGLIGSHLTVFLIDRGHDVAHLGRKKMHEGKVRHFNWDLEKEVMDVEACQWADAIIHLAGANVSEKRWTEKRKKEIIDSRVKGAQLLARNFRDQKTIPKVIVSASGVGYYGMETIERIFSETDPPSKDFFGECCSKWETSIDLFEEIGMRTVKLRIGVVLAKEGGALPKLAGPVKWMIGSPLASGKQWMPWIHIDDVCELFLRAIEDDNMHGVYNAIASQQITNKQFVKTIGKVLHRPVFFPRIPKFVLKMMLGEMSGIVTEGSRVSNEKLLKTGFAFKHVELENAMKDLLEKKR